MSAATLPRPEECNCFAVRSAARHVTQFYDKFLAPSGLRATQFAILARLKRLGPLTIKLQPCGSISGRLVDADGVPVVNNRRVYFISWPHFLTTDKDGCFHVQGLVPGLGYSIVDDKRKFQLLPGVVVEPGKDKDLGDIKVSDN